MGLISGKQLSDVMLAIKAPYKAEKKRKESYSYIPYSAYLERLDEILGPQHYQIHYSDIQNILLPSKQIFLSCICELSFIDDEEKVCFTTHGIGTFELVYSANSGRYIMLDNSGIRLQQQALKSACKSIQIFGEKITDGEPEEKNSVSSKDFSNNENSNRLAIKEVFCTSGPFQIIREDKKVKNRFIKYMDIGLLEQLWNGHCRLFFFIRICTAVV